MSLTEKNDQLDYNLSNSSQSMSVSTEELESMGVLAVYGVLPDNSTSVPQASGLIGSLLLTVHEVRVLYSYVQKRIRGIWWQ